MPEEFINKLAKLNSRFDEIVPRVLAEGAEPAFVRAKSNLEQRIGQGTKYSSVSSGELLKSMETTPPVQRSNGDWTLRVGVPTTVDSNRVSNALKAAVIEYGKSGQPPKPWLKQAKRASKKACIQAMKNALDKEIEKL